MRHGTRRRMFTITGTVISGDKVGRTIGFPTANLDVTISEADLKPGVYAGYCRFNSLKSTQEYTCVAYFGPRLIFNELRNSFEVFIVGFNQEIYGEELAVDLLHFVRAPLPFTGLADLQKQLERDVQAGLKLLESSPPDVLQREEIQ